MEISEEAQEILETLWMSTEEEKKDFVDLKSLKISKNVVPIEELTKHKLVILSGPGIKLSPEGRREGENIVRRHRLAERLLVDVLDIKGKLVHETACHFEHLLHKGIDESICILLGHPRVCPHRKAIPLGKCCHVTKESTTKIVSSLADLKPTQKGKIAYIYTKEPKKLRKLMATGILPGKSITLLQKFPSYVFQVGQTQIAVDKEMADAIYVRLTE
ncbi:hypothetical protein LCGC14_2843990 [marine sediment metagenome]|uniref:Ferrous iron transporter FeoA-like domain-containing protein n=1 Tax=marine sediment metagenome TaxID=412755 RepID=A0A0F8YX42_9ZZZZ